MKILLVDDEKLIRITLGDLLKDHGHELTLCDNGADAIAHLQAEHFDVVVTDLRLPKAGGIEVLTAAKQRHPRIGALLITAYGSHETSLEAMRLGAEYVTKPFLNDDIVLRIRNMEQTRSLADENLRLKSELKKRYGFESMVGSGPAMRQVFDLIKTVARNDFSVLILGESGTGKELAATALHYNSPRAEKPLIRVSCAALPENLLEDEMFGHEKGAFTDARERKPGRFELAEGGSLFLDDIDDMPLGLQVKLLRVLQEREIERLGGTKPIRIDIRVIAATKVDLGELVQQGKFRQDLYYRLNVVPLRLPPLRDHLEDLDPLIDHFIRLHGGGKRYRVSAATLSYARRHRWPGNIRELENATQRAIALAGDTQLELSAHHLVPNPVPNTGASDSTPAAIPTAITAPQPAATPAGQSTATSPLPATGAVTPPNQFAAIPSPEAGPEQLAALVQLIYPAQIRPLKEVLHQLEAIYLKHVLELAGDNRTKAADLLAISRKNLWEKLRDLGISNKE